MKKKLSFLSIISLFTIISSNIIACNTPDANSIINKPIKDEFKPQQPPENSKWKLVDNSRENLSQEFHTLLNNKWYIMIYGGSQKLITMAKRDQHGKLAVYDSGIYTKIIFGDIEYFNIQNISVYRWDGVGKPTTPTINKDNGEITDWNEKIES